MSVAISINSEQLGLRLLELPPELISLLESSDPPTLHLKSSDKPQAQANAVLCTPDKTFEVRQVMSSNVSYILQKAGNDAYTAVAQCKGALELIPSKANAAEYLRQILPIYTGEYLAQDCITQAKLNADAPFSGEELRNASKELCVFEHHAKLYIPMPGLLVDAWKSLVTAATINGIRLESPWSMEELQAQVSEDGIDLGIYSAMISRLNKNGAGTQLDASSTVIWVGQVLLESQATPLSETALVGLWQDLLPEIWRQHASLEMLQDKYVLSSDGSISAKHHSALVSDAETPKVQPRSKWHDKFRR